MMVDARLFRAAFASVGETFRGEIWENCSRFRLVGPAYAAMPREQDGHFQIRTARQLAGPLRAMKDPAVRTAIIIGATQVLKSVAGDIWVPYIMEHCPRNMLVLFEDDPKAKLFCDARLMDTIYQHEILAKLIENVDRHDATKTVIKLPSMMLKVCGMNEGNVSSLSWPLIWISEAWQHRSDGLLRKAIKRADRFPNDCKILIESQAGYADEDLHREVKGSHIVPLTWACPHCGGRQTWEFGQLRPDEFVPCGTAKPGTYSGMKFDEDGDIATRARSAQWECYHCGERIADTLSNRQKIMDSYEQDYTIAGPNGTRISPKSVTFILPKEAARDNSFEDSAKAFLTAKSAERQGNKTPLEDWYMAERAVFYSSKLTQTPVSIITGSATGAQLIPDEACRVMVIDAQQGDIAQKTGKFWYIARAVDKYGNLFQLARGYAESWKDWFEVQKRLKIPNDNVAVDGAKYLHEILDAAAANYEIVDRQPMRNGRPCGKPFKARAVWKILIGNGTKKSFPHGDALWRSFSKPTYYERTIPVGNDRTAIINISVTYWSNLSVKDHLQVLMLGGPKVPKFIALPFDQLSPSVQMKEMGELSYTKQMQNEYRERVKGKDTWVQANPNCHYRDCECMSLVLFDMGGYLGLPAAAEGDGQAA